MADTTKKILIDATVSSNSGDAIKDMAKLREEQERLQLAINEVNARIREQGYATKADREEIIKLTEEKKAYASEERALSKQIQNTIVAEQTHQNTLKGLRAELVNAKNALAQMELGTEAYRKQNKYVDELNDKVKALEYSYGVFSRNVGNYGNAIDSLKGEARGLIDTLKNLNNEGEVSDMTASKLAKQADSLRSRMSDLEIAIAQAGGTTTEQGKAMQEQFNELQVSLQQVEEGLAQIGKSESVNTLAKDIKGLTSASLLLMAAVMGTDSKEKENRKTVQNLQKAMMALVLVQNLSATASKKGTVARIAENAVQRLGIDQTKAEAKAQASLTVLKGSGTVATKALAAAQWLWNAALSANPIFLIITGVGLLIAGVKALTSAFDSSTKALKKAAKAQEDYETAAQKTSKTVAYLNAKALAESGDITIKMNEEIKAMMKSGASAEQIAQKRAKYEKELRNITVRSAQDRIKAEEELKDKALENYNKQKDALDVLIKKKGEDAKKTQEQQKAVDEAYATYIEKLNAYNNTAVEISNTQIEQSEADYNARKEANNKAFEQQSKHYNSLAELENARLKTKQQYLYDDTKSVQENSEAQFQYQQGIEYKLFALRQRQQKRLLELQKKYGKITTEEYENSLKVMEEESSEFYLQIQEKANEHQRQAVASAIQLAGGKMLESQLEDIEEKYSNALATIKSDSNRSREEIAFYEEALEQRKEAEIRALRESSRKQTEDRIKAIISDSYKDDLRQFSDNEKTKTAYEIEVARKTIEEKKKAGLATYEDEAKLRALQSKQSQQQLNSELQLAWKDADKRYQIQKEYYEKELQLAELSAEKRSELEQKLHELTRQYNNEKIAMFEEYASKVSDLASSVTDLFSNLSDARIQKAESESKAKKSSLDKQLKAGLISQKQYDRQTAKLDEDLDKKKAKIQRQQAIREKAVNASQTVMNTATAIMKTAANLGYPAAIPMVSLLGVQGALQLATILAEPLPVARQGGKIVGATHEQGGVLVNTEDEERIISREPAKAFPELLNLISYIGKHASIPDTGYAGRFLQQVTSTADIDYDALASKIGERVGDAVRGLNVVVSIEALDNARTEQVRVEQAAKL